ncbi:hypothetical protein EON79_11335 [bacterium]|nr:MAG: hypothetical protein EON79_11335 [bacterium]
MTSPKIPIKPVRMHLLPAKEAPICVVMARIVKTQWHILLWDLDAGTLRQGSWFTGKLLPLDSDVSWDGRHLIYSAAVRNRNSDNAWVGLCELPWLRTLAHINDRITDSTDFEDGTGGGVFVGRDVLHWHGRSKQPIEASEDLPYRTEFSGEIHPWARILERNGWTFEADSAHRRKMSVKRQAHPRLPLTIEAYPEGRIYQRHWEGPAWDPFFEDDLRLEGRPDLFNERTAWATWDSRGDLLWVEEGCLYRAHAETLLAGGGPFQKFDLNPLKLIPREARKADPSRIEYLEPSPL